MRSAASGWGTGVWRSSTPKAGHQPMYNEDGSVAIVYNGMIYNFQDLRPELEARGHVFRTRCDTETIIHAWESWGPECLQRLNGFFAFALWDRNRRELFLARDRMGKKPIYYATLPDGRFVFGSEMAALKVVPGLGRTVSPTAVEDFFAYGYVPDPASIYRGDPQASGRALSAAAARGEGARAETLLAAGGEAAPDHGARGDCRTALEADGKHAEPVDRRRAAGGVPVGRRGFRGRGGHRGAAAGRAGHVHDRLCRRRG